MADEDHAEYPQQEDTETKSNEFAGSLIEPSLKELGSDKEEEGQSRETGKSSQTKSSASSNQPSNDKFQLITSYIIAPRDSDRLPEILTSPWPEEMQAHEDPSQYLPDTIDYTKVRPVQLAEWKARAPNCYIIEDYIRPRLINVPRTNAKKANAGHTLNEMERKWRGQRGIFVGNWISGVKGKMPGITQKNFNRLSDLQLLYRTWGEIDLATHTHKVQGHTYPLRAPLDVPQKAWLALQALNRAIPSRWAHLKAHPDLWLHFDAEEYHAHLRTETIMDTDPGDAGWLEIMSRQVDVLDPFGGLGLPPRSEIVGRVRGARKRAKKERKGKDKDKGNEGGEGRNMAKSFAE